MGTCCSTKYYIFTSKVYSNPYYDMTISDSITKSEVINAFNLSHCNENGIVLQVNQSLT